MNGFKLIDKGNLKYYSIPAFENTGLVTAAFTTRWGGGSETPYNNMNMGLHVGDKPADVIKNRIIMTDELGYSLEDIVCAQQVHGSNVAVINDSHRGLGSKEYEDSLGDTDALITNQPGILLLINYADCVPIFLLDPVEKAIGLAHAGWKGTVAGIGVKTIKKMKEEFGTKEINLLAAIGPSIGPCCYEVDERLFNEFTTSFEFAEEILYASSEGKWQLDLWEANRRQLLLKGLLETNIVNSKICTSCNNNLLFSHRADGGQTGRLSAMLGINN